MEKNIEKKWDFNRQHSSRKQHDPKDLKKFLIADSFIILIRKTHVKLRIFSIFAQPKHSAKSVNQIFFLRSNVRQIAFWLWLNELFAHQVKTSHKIYISIFVVEVQSSAWLYFSGWINVEHFELWTWLLQQHVWYWKIKIDENRKRIFQHQRLVQEARYYHYYYSIHSTWHSDSSHNMTFYYSANQCRNVEMWFLKSKLKMLSKYIIWYVQYV